MNNLKLSLLKKWELDSELSFVHGSVLLLDGTAIILTSVTPMVLWIRRFCAASRIGSVRSSSTTGSVLRCWRSMMGRCRSADRMMLSM